MPICLYPSESERLSDLMAFHVADMRVCVSSIHTSSDNKNLRATCTAVDKPSSTLTQQGANMPVYLYPSESERLSDLVRMPMHSDTDKKILHSS